MPPRPLRRDRRTARRADALQQSSLPPHATCFCAAAEAEAPVAAIRRYRGVRRHGLIMGCSVTGVKPKVGRRYVACGARHAQGLLFSSTAAPHSSRHAEHACAVSTHRAFPLTHTSCSTPAAFVARKVAPPAHPPPATTSHANPSPPRCALQAGASPLQLGPKAEVSNKQNSNPLLGLLRLLLGTAAGFYYFLVPIYMCVMDAAWSLGAMEVGERRQSPVGQDGLRLCMGSPRDTRHDTRA
jgi:hypothetical protein